MTIGSDEFLLKKEKMQSEAQSSSDITCSLASIHMGLSPLAYPVTLMLVGTHWLLRRGTNCFWFFSVKKLLLFLEQALEMWNTLSFLIF